MWGIDASRDVGPLRSRPTRFHGGLSDKKRGRIQQRFAQGTLSSLPLSCTMHVPCARETLESLFPSLLRGVLRTSAGKCGVTWTS